MSEMLLQCVYKKISERHTDKFMLDKLSKKMRVNLYGCKNCSGYDYVDCDNYDTGYKEVK